MKINRHSSCKPTTFLTSLHILLIVMSWISLIYIIVQVHPSNWQQYYYTPFFGLIFLSLSLSFLFLSHNIAFSIFIPLGIIGILVLRLFGIKDWYNPLLITALSITLIYFFTVREDRDTLSKSTSIKQSNPPASS
jgi:hypothetical protein